MDTKQNKPGPEPERLKIEGDWEDAVKKAIEAHPPSAPEDESDEAESENESAKPATDDPT